jgi:glycerol kinase
MGAAFLAGLAVGYWKDTKDVKQSWLLGHSFEPGMPQGEREELLAGWKRAVGTAIAWTHS